MSRALPPLKGHLRKKVQPKPSTPALPEGNFTYAANFGTYQHF